MSRLNVLSGRAGATFIALGLALTLVSLIPARQDFEYDSVYFVNKETFAMGYSLVLTPQHVLKLTASANRTVSLYLIGKSSTYLYEWMSNQYLVLYGDNNDPYMINDAYAMNVSLLDSFIDAHPQSILIEESVDTESRSFEYSPTKVTNATLIFANRGDSITAVNSQTILSNVIGPKRVILPAQILVPLGAILVLPWLISLWKEKTRPRQQQGL